MKKSTLLSILIALMFLTNADAANYGMMGGDGLTLAGDFWFTIRAAEREISPNTNFHGDDPFNVIRVRTFLAKQWNPKTAMVVEFLWDEQAPPRIQGAYLTLTDLIGPIGLRAGKIPSPFGNYGTRSTYFNQNPLIGVPAMWHYRTPFGSTATSTNSSLISRKARINRGTPVGYDACWDYALEAFFDGKFWEGGVAGTYGTLGSMAAAANLGYQFVGRIGLKPIEGMRAGLSYAQGPYIRPDTVAAQQTIDILGYDQMAVGYYWEYTWNTFQFYSEGMNSTFEAPFVKGANLGIATGYLEGRWNFIPGWYLAGRYDIFNYNEIPSFNDGTGPKEKWGYDLNRVEIAVGFRPIREAIIRLDWQGSFYSESQDPIHLIALQFGYAF